jgi:predicted  nucleic acid-binding Zn-ribbon protein
VLFYFRLNLSETECTRLRSQLASYQEAQTSDYRAQLSIEIDARKRLEVEAGRISAALEKCQRELASSSGRASALRAEGRHVRRCVLDVAEQLHSLVGEMRQGQGQGQGQGDSGRAPGSLLAAALGLKTNGPNTSSASFTEAAVGGMFVQTVDGEGVRSSSALRPRGSEGGEGEGEGESVHELTHALENIRKTISWLQSVSSRGGLGDDRDSAGRLRRLEADNARLVREADSNAGLAEERSRRLQAEVASLEGLLNAARQREAGRMQDLDSRRSEIETETMQGRGQLKKVESELGRAMDRLSELETDNDRLQKEISKLSGAASKADETEVLRRALAAAKGEAQLLTQRNGHLVDTVSSLEALAQRSSAAADSSLGDMGRTGQLPGIAHLTSTLGSGEFLKSLDPQHSTQIHEGILQLQRHLGKYRLRAKMFEEMSDIFRGAYLSCAAGVPVGSTNANSSSARNGILVQSPPYGRVVEAVRKSYEESMSLLEEQVESCLGVIRQNNAYMTELRTRLEDTLRALYK